MGLKVLYTGKTDTRQSKARVPSNLWTYRHELTDRELVNVWFYRQRCFGLFGKSTVLGWLRGKVQLEWFQITMPRKTFAAAETDSAAVVPRLQECKIRNYGDT